MSSYCWHCDLILLFIATYCLSLRFGLLYKCWFCSFLVDWVAVCGPGARWRTSDDTGSREAINAAVELLSCISQHKDLVSNKPFGSEVPAMVEWQAAERRSIDFRWPAISATSVFFFTKIDTLFGLPRWQPLRWDPTAINTDSRRQQDSWLPSRPLWGNDPLHCPSLLLFVEMVYLQYSVSSMMFLLCPSSFHC